MDVAVPARQRDGESGIDAVVVEDADERLIQGEQTDGQGGGRGDQRRAYFARGTNRLYRTIWKSAASPSRHVIFLPSAYVRPL